jgi:hypothetical protein
LNESKSLRKSSNLEQTVLFASEMDIGAPGKFFWFIKLIKDDFIPLILLLGSSAIKCGDEIH